jgi:ATP-binding cassette subfamily B protein
MGASGTGKSTLLDVVMGLLEPTVGSVNVDNLPIAESNRRSWQANVAHVPQSVFIADISVEENIAFGVPKHLIDSERVKTCARKAQIDGTIEGLPDQYQTSLGDRGVRLSGGQRQRIGIARALYKQAEVIIFDEATSALDHETEGDVMKAIESLSKNLTIFIIAHRLSTLRMCSRVVELQNGGVLREVEPHLVFLDE